LTVPDKVTSYEQLQKLTQVLNVYREIIPLDVRTKAMQGLRQGQLETGVYIKIANIIQNYQTNITSFKLLPNEHVLWEHHITKGVFIKR
jgi:hypothetical protein